MWVQIVIALVLMAVSYMLAPKPRQPQPEVQEGDVPTASASNPIPVVFGEVDIEESNCVWWGDPSTEAIYTKSGKK